MLPRCGGQPPVKGRVLSARCVFFRDSFFQEKFSGIKFSGDVLWVGFSEEAVRVSVAGLYGRPEERICAYNNIGMAGRGPARVVSLAFLCIRRSD